MHDRWVSQFTRPAAANVLALKRFVETNPQMKEPQMPHDSPAIGTASMIQVEIEVTIKAPRQRVWQALLHESPAWWRKDFFTSPKTRAFIIEPRVGGRAYEDYGDGNGAIWFTVNLLDAPNRLQWTGQMGGSFPGPAISIVEINLIPAADGTATVLKLRDQLIGKVNEKSIEDMTSGWKMLMDEGLRGYVEKK
jgi:uncharacterized protein YndB with AHSA1/START domain